MIILFLELKLFWLNALNFTFYKTIIIKFYQTLQNINFVGLGFVYDRVMCRKFNVSMLGGHISRNRHNTMADTIHTHTQTHMHIQDNMIKQNYYGTNVSFLRFAIGSDFNFNYFKNKNQFVCC